MEFAGNASAGVPILDQVRTGILEPAGPMLGCNACKIRSLFVQ